MSMNYFGAERLYASRARGREYKVLNAAGYRNCGLRYDPKHDRYIVAFHGTDILAIYRDRYELLSTYDSATTRLRLSSLMRCMIHRSSTTSWGDYMFVGGYPAFEGMRIHPNGAVFDEDKRPMKKRVPTQEAARAWRALRLAIARQAVGRTMIGEVGEWSRMRRVPDVLLAFMEDPTRILTSQDLGVMQEVPPPGVGIGAVSQAQREAAVQNALRVMRGIYLERVDGYDIVEIK